MGGRGLGQPAGGIQLGTTQVLLVCDTRVCVDIVVCDTVVMHMYVLCVTL